MYTIIQKQPKIQLFHFRNPTSTGIRDSFAQHNAEWDSVIHIYLLQFKHRSTVESILSNESYTKELDWYWIWEILWSYFKEHRSAWYELKRKIHAFRKNDKWRWYIGKEDEDKLLSIFIRHGESVGLSDQIEQEFRENILTNQRLLNSIQKEPSILDSSHGEIQSICWDKWQKKQFIKNIIHYGIISNSNGWEWSLDDRFQEIFPIIVKYLKSIFHIEFNNIKTISTLDDLSDYIYELIWWNDTTGIKAKEGWTLAKAFTAWGGYPEIKKLQEQAKISVRLLPTRLNELWIELKDEREIEREIDGEVFTITQANAHCNINGENFVFKIEFRVKSMRSILLKLWENEDYNNGDAVRDLVGIANIGNDDLSPETHASIIRLFTDLMYHKSYLAKEKWLFSSNAGVNIFKWMLQSVPNKPFGKIVTAKGLKSSPEFSNASLSGFGNMWDNVPTWIEIQQHTQESASFWKEDHFTFDPLKVVKAWSRWSWFITPHQLQNTICEEIPKEVLFKIIKKTPNQILWSYITSHRILAYVSESQEVFLVPKDHKNEFELKKANGIHLIKKPADNTDLRNFILNLWTNNALNDALTIL